MLRSQAGAGSAVDDPGGGNTDDLGSFGNLVLCDVFLKDFRVVCLLFFDDRKFFVVPFGQVSSGCGR